jgi:molecular chaperone DnaK (HSP70)
MDQLNAKGYDLRLNLEQPADKVVFAKLMVYAEQAKIALSKKESYEIEEPTTGITDHAGNPVAIYLGITRKKFEEMINEQIEYSVQVCRRAITEKAQPPIESDQIDEIIMVGGSSRIPIIAARLEAEFGKPPKLVKPDLCVALGAAIIAGTKGQTFGCLKLDTIPTETDLPSLVVTGRVIPSDGLQSVQGCVVSLRSLDGAYKSSRTIGTEGAFVFDEVPLAPEETTEFTLSVNSPAGQSVATHRFSVAQTEASTRSQVEAVTNMLSKPIGIATVEGLHEIAPERTPLPYETVVRAKTMDASGEIRVPILEENNPLGVLLMKDIPTTLPVGSAVEISLTVEENYQIRGRAFVPSLAREATIVIDIPVRPQKSVDELRRQYELLQARADDALAASSRGARFGDAKVKRLKERMQHAEEMLRSRALDPAAIQDCLDEIESLVRDIGTGWRPEPPRAVFDQKADEAQDLLATAIKKKPKVAEDGYDKQITAIRSEAEKAYTAQNSAAWKDSYRKLATLCDRLEGLIEKSEGGGGQQPQQDPGTLLLILARDLMALEEWAKDEGAYAQYEGEFRDAAAALKRINPDAPDAMNQIRDWYLTKFDRLRQRLKAPQGTGLVGLG